MKRLTLDQTWEQCLAMWKWMVEQLDAGSEKSTKLLKQDYMAISGLSMDNGDNCFFCDYHEAAGFEILDGFDSDEPICQKCPGCLIDPSFDCMCEDYHHSHPRLFYAKLKELNKIRLDKK